MEMVDWDELAEDESSDPFCEPCVKELLRDAPADCLYCRLGDLGDGADD